MGTHSQGIDSLAQKRNTYVGCGDTPNLLTWISPGNVTRKMVEI